MATPDHTPQGRGYDTSFVRCRSWCSRVAVALILLKFINSLEVTTTLSPRLHLGLLCELIGCLFGSKFK